MTYAELFKEAMQHISSDIIDYRPACGLYVEGMDDCEQIPRAIVCWLENGSQIIYINNDKGKRGVSMTESEAKTILERDLNCLKQNKALPDSIEAMEMAINALEKQIAKKPILKHDVSVMHLNRGNQPHEWKRLESDNWHCPECDSFVGERVYVHDRHHDQRKKKYCDNCGQKLNWESDEE